MTEIVEQFTNEQLQFLIFLGLSLGVAGFTAFLYFRRGNIYKPYFGRVNPLVVIFLIILLGFILFSFLLSRGWFAIYQTENLRGLVISLGLGSLFGFVIILVDLKVVFPDDFNVLLPESLLFYPSSGYAAEILFHVLPLSTLLIVLTSLFENISFEGVIWPCILIVALIEPVYQTVSGFSRPYPLWVSGYVGLHVFLINLSQLLIFKRYDFISMYSLRMVYYLIWHIVWGSLRLKLLF